MRIASSALYAAAAVCAFHGFAGAGLAHETDLKTYSFEDKADDMNGIFIEVDGVSAQDTNWFRSDIIEGQYFSIQMTDLSVALIRTTNRPWLASTVQINSLDYLHSGRTWLHSDQKYDMRLYFGQYFFWIEVKKSEPYVQPVYSTIFFTGIPRKVYRHYLTTSRPDVRYFRYHDLKEEIDKDYVSLYDAEAPGLSEFTGPGKAAIATMGAPAMFVPKPPPPPPHF